jgi:hypothetical protein
MRALARQVQVRCSGGEEWRSERLVEQCYAWSVPNDWCCVECPRLYADPKAGNL